MKPLGFLYKNVAPRPDWLWNPQVTDIYSVSGCISEAFVDYVQAWKHNGFWFFDSPQVMVELAAERGISLQASSLFYYEAHEQEFDSATRSWNDFRQDASISVSVVAPSAASLQGYDVTSYSTDTMPECSPLSCNALADQLTVNEHCLFRTFDEAKAALEQGRFDDSEPGPYRIIAVYAVTP